jgi:hypothetical protein
MGWRRGSQYRGSRLTPVEGRASVKGGRKKQRRTWGLTTLAGSAVFDTVPSGPPLRIRCATSCDCVERSPWEVFGRCSTHPFHYALDQFALLKRGVPNPHTYEPCSGFVYFDIACELPSRNALFGRQYERDCEKPLLQRQVGMMENGAYVDTETGIATIAVMTSLARYRACARGVAVRADGLSVPTNALKVGDAVCFGG